MPRSRRTGTSSVCWNCERGADEAISVSLRAPAAGHAVLTLCRACHASSYLPLAGEVDELAPGTDPRKCVLIVEDAPNLRRLLSLTLEAEGYAVDTAANGLEALLQACRRMPDLVILDLHMPVMNGHKFLDAWRQVMAAKPVPVLAISAHEAHQTAAEPGVSAFLPKPFELDALIGTVGTLVRRAS